MKILIVDDEINIVNILSELLEEYHTVISTYSSKEAISIFNENTPDLVITDFNMPVINGRDLSKMFFEQKQIKSIIITGDTGANFGVGYVEFIHKPINFGKLMDSISKYEKLWIN